MKSSTVFVLLPAPKRRLSHGKQPVELALQQTKPSLSRSSQTSDEELDSDAESGSDYETSAESDASEHNEPLVPSPTTKSRPSSSRGISIVRNPSSSSKPRPYVCTHSGCDKSYRKPSRLQEHERSHTGEVRPTRALNG